MKTKAILALAASGLLLSVSSPPAAGAERREPLECSTYTLLGPAVLHDFLESYTVRGLSYKDIESGAETALSHTWCVVGETLEALGYDIKGLDQPKDGLQLRAEFRTNVLRSLAELFGAVPESGGFTQTELRKRLMATLKDKFGQTADINNIRIVPRDLVVPVAGRAGDDDPLPPRKNKSQEAPDNKPKPAAEEQAPQPQAGQSSATKGLKCRSATELQNSSDPDVRNNAEQLAAAGICYSVRTVKERGLSWTFQTFLNAVNPDGPAWFLPHDNENTAFNAAMYALERYGGKVLTVHSGEKRNLGKTDPNRNFGIEKAEIKACKNLKGKPTPKYSRTVLDFFVGQPAVLTMHNNTNGGTVSAAHTDGKNRGMLAAGPPISKDPDDFIYVTGSKPFSKDKKIRQDVIALRKDGLNVVHEFVTLKNTDCSLSNFAAYRKLRYFNIEAQHNHLTQQTKMVDALMRHLKYP